MNAAERAVRRIDRFQQSHPLLAFPFAVAQKFGNDRAGAFATRIAYRGLFALFPLLLLLTTVLGFVLAGHPALRTSVLSSAVAQFPVIGPELRSQAHPLRGSGIGLAVGIAGTVWGALGVGQAAESALNTIWNVPYVDWPNFFVRRLRSVALLGVLGAGTLVSGGLSVFSTTVASGVERPAAYVVSVLTAFGVLLAAFKVLTAEPLGWRDVALSAGIATVFWTALEAVGGWYVARSLHTASATYGLFAVVIALLSWMFLAAQLILLAVEIDVVRKYRLWPRSLTQPPLTDADMAVFERLAHLEKRRPEYEVDVTFAPAARRDPLKRPAP